LANLSLVQTQKSRCIVPALDITLIYNSIFF
jgi:hypothetical protein